MRKDLAGAHAVPLDELACLPAFAGAGLALSFSGEALPAGKFLPLGTGERGGSSREGGDWLGFPETCLGWEITPGSLPLGSGRRLDRLAR